MDASVTESAKLRKRQSGMSYKFQRLREKIRRAVETGELSGKLPGERVLARRFHVNAKTLSKALTDLAAEGLLDRSIGRGTYVKGSEPAAPACDGPWLVLSVPGAENACPIEHLRKTCPELHVAASVEAMRPSFLNQFTAVISLSPETPESFMRELIVRNIPVVALDYEPKTYSMHSVMADVALGVARLGRDLLLAGHRRIAAVESRGNDAVSHTLRQTAARYSTEASIEIVEPMEAATVVDDGVTALVCGSIRDMRQAHSGLATRGIDVPGQVSLVTVGCACPAECSGYFVQCQQFSDAVVDLLRNPLTRPVTLWLPGAWIDRGTLAPTGAALPLDQTASLRVSGVVV